MGVYSSWNNLPDRGSFSWQSEDARRRSAAGAGSAGPDRKQAPPTKTQVGLPMQRAEGEGEERTRAVVSIKNLPANPSPSELQTLLESLSGVAILHLSLHFRPTPPAPRTPPPTHRPTPSSEARLLPRDSPNVEDPSAASEGERASQSEGAAADASAAAAGAGVGAASAGQADTGLQAFAVAEVSYLT